MSSTDQSVSQTQSPGKTALTISLVVFVSVTSLFTAAMAVAIAPIQMHTTGITGDPQTPSNTARWLCYLLAVLTIANGVYVVRKGRKNASVIAIGSALFVAANIALVYLYLRTW